MRAGKGDGEDRSGKVLDVVGKSDGRRWPLDFASAVEAIRVVVEVEELVWGAGDLIPDGNDWRSLTRARRDLSLSMRAGVSAGRFLGALSAAMFRKRSSACSLSVPDDSVAPWPLLAE